MTRRIPAAVLVALGTLILVLAVLSATVWRPDDRATVSLPARPEQPLVVSDAGVLDAVAEEVAITATAEEDEPVVLAVGRTADVEAWAGQTPSLHITGLSSWEELAVGERAGADGEETPVGGGEAGAEEEATSPAGSDLWVTESTGTGRAELEWEHRAGRWSLIAATDGAAAAPRVSLTWPVEVSTPWLVPGVVVGALLLLAGLALVVLDVLARREAERRRATARQRAETRAAADVSPTAVLTPVAGAGLTRRQLRARAQPERVGRRGLGTLHRDRPSTPTTDALTEAGPARGAGVVPGAREKDPTVPLAAADRGEGAPADGRAPADHDEPSASSEAATSQWRSLWGVTGRPTTEQGADDDLSQSRTTDAEPDR